MMFRLVRHLHMNRVVDEAVGFSPLTLEEVLLNSSYFVSGRQSWWVGVV